MRSIAQPTTLTPLTDIVPLLDAELAIAFQQIPPPPTGGHAVELRRAAARQFAAALRAGYAPSDDFRITDLQVPARLDQPAVALRVFAPRVRRSDLVLLWMHGGGFSSGHHEDDDIVVRPWVLEIGCTVVSVGYRLAPEHAHPAAANDCYAALEWLAGAAQPLGFAPQRIAVGGISAGAALAAATALRARDAAGPALCFQLLLVPCADNRSSTPSMQVFKDVRQWHQAANIKAWALYAGGDGAVSPYAAPARADDLCGLPPAYIEIAGADPLRDEGLAYGERLMQAGVTVELHVFPGAYHASTYLQPQAAISRRAQAEALAALRRVCAARD